MAIERRDEHTEVVNLNAADVGLGDVSTSGPVRTTARQTATFTSDPYAVRREQTIKLQKGIYLLFGILEGLLGIRFVLGLLGANPAADFAQFIYGITKPFIAPFVGLFGQPRFEGSVFEWNSLVAILVYVLIAWVLVKIVWLMLGDSRRGVRTTTSSHSDNA
ncbi:MAG: YggT family protein [Chloroflexi bacterium]|nr:YggT family protein [Chloroflexota bacterium]